MPIQNKDLIGCGTGRALDRVLGFMDDRTWCGTLVDIEGGGESPGVSIAWTCAYEVDKDSVQKQVLQSAA